MIWSRLNTQETGRERRVEEPRCDEPSVYRLDKPSGCVKVQSSGEILVKDDAQCGNVDYI